MKKLSVIIVSYRAEKVLCDCLDSIVKYNDIGEDLEVIVSDNSPDNILVDNINKKYPWVITVKNENIGFGAGNNRGVDLAQGAYFLFLNPDTILVEPIFSFALEKFENDGNLALFGLQLITVDRKNNASFFFMDRHGICASLSEKVHRKKGRYVDGKMFICGADMFVRRQAFFEAGRFDENIFMYKEEPDLIRRIKLYSSAKRTEFFGEKKIIHLEGGSGTKCKNIKAIERLVDSDVYYAEKWQLDFNKVLKGRIRYERFKKVIFYLIFNKEKAKRQTEIIRYYQSRISQRSGR